MALVKQRARNLLGGVSEAPCSQKRSNQVRSLINGLATPTRGLVKRPPVEDHITASTEELSALPQHLVVRDGSTKHLIVYDNVDEELRVFDVVSGDPVAVSGGSGVDYLGPASNLRFVTVGDVTYILNPDVVVDEDVTATAANVAADYDQALVWFRDTVAGDTYTISVLRLATSIFPISVTPSTNEPAEVVSDYVATINGNYGDLVATAYGPVLHLESSNPATRLIGVTGATSNITIIHRSVSTAAELPPTAPDGFFVQVSGDASTGADNYWVAFDASAQRWVEVAAPDTVGALDPGTMPLVLTYDPSGGTYALAEGSWEQRQVGDATSNPLPSFVDRTISEIFFHQGRLGFISGPAIVTSRAGEPLAFFRSTIRSLQDNEPIDVESTRSAGFHSVVEFDEQLILFSETENFILHGSPVLTPQSVRLDPLSAFGSHGGLRPVVSGDVVLLAREMDGNTQLVAWGKRRDAPAFGVDLTLDVPSYIKGTPYAIAGDSTLGFLAVATTNGTGSDLYVCTYNVNGREGVPMASWAKWVIEGQNILNIAMVDGKLLVSLSADDTWTFVGEINVRRAFTEEGGAGAAGLDFGFFPFDFSVELCRINLRDPEDNVISNGRLTLHYLDVLLGKSTSLEAHVTPSGRTTRAPTYYTASPAAEGVLHIPIRAEGPKTAIVLRSNNIGNCAITGLLWEGDYHDEYSTGAPG